MLPLAHVVHQLIWVLYAVPVLIVSAAIVKSFISQRQPAHAPPTGTHRPPAASPTGTHRPPADAPPTGTHRPPADAPPAGGDDREDSRGRESPRSETGPAGRGAGP